MVQFEFTKCVTSATSGLMSGTVKGVCGTLDLSMVIIGNGGHYYKDLVIVHAQSANGLGNNSSLDNENHEIHVSNEVRG